MLRSSSQVKQMKGEIGNREQEIDKEMGCTSEK